MKSVALLMLVLLTASYPAMARPYHGHRHVAPESHSGVTCEMVRAYVAQVGLAGAVAMAKAAGITSSEKERARQCLAEKS
jgi:hypothetical protein